MVHPLVSQLHFARAEFQRCLSGLSAEDAVRRILPMNSISWMIGHLANQEHRLWVMMAQEADVAPGLREQFGFGKPACTPPLEEMWAQWRAVTAAADTYLNSITAQTLDVQLSWQGQGRVHHERVGKLLLRNIFHYWFHLGEAHAVRQSLGHTGLPEFVGDMSAVDYA